MGPDARKTYTGATLRVIKDEPEIVHGLAPFGTSLLRLHVAVSSCWE